MGSQISDGPGPAVPTSPADVDIDDEDLKYFQSLPEHVLESLYPRGIRPPTNLGPTTPYDRYDQFHQAILHLAAGVELADVMRIGDFDIDGRQFIKHMALFSAKSSDYSDQDLMRVRGEILGQSCTHRQGDNFCLKCSEGEFITLNSSADARSEKQMGSYQKCLDKVTSKSAADTDKVPKSELPRYSLPALYTASTKRMKVLAVALIQFGLVILGIWLVLHLLLLHPIWYPKNDVAKNDPELKGWAQVKQYVDRDVTDDLILLVGKHHGNMNAVLLKEYGGDLGLLDHDIERFVRHLLGPARSVTEREDHELLQRSMQPKRTTTQKAEDKEKTLDESRR